MIRGLGALVRKDLLRQLKDAKGFAIYMCVPLLLTFIMGISFGGGVFGESGISAVPLVICGGDLPSVLEDRLAQGLQESGFFQVTWADTAEAARLVSRGDASAALVLPDGLLRDFFSGRAVEVQLWKDPNSAVKAGIVESILAGVMRQYQAGEAAYRALWPEDAFPEAAGEDDAVDALFGGEPDRLLRSLREDATFGREFLDRLERGAVFARTLETPSISLELHDRQDWEAAQGDARQSRNLHDYFLPAFAVFFMMFSAAAMARELHRERETRTLARLLTGPVTVGTVALGKWLTAVIMCSLQLLVLLACGGLLFQLRVGSAPVALLFVSVAAAAAAASVYLALGLVVRTEKAMDALTTVFTLTCGMLGGNFFPVEFMPPALHYAGLVTFNYWANRAFSDLITRGEGLASVTPAIVVLWTIAVVGLVLAIAIFTVRQRKGVAA
ncbi:MAG TPA: ABC transporter permease [Candidatus Krumholzibacteria bacterium]|nr:ABC transporter permease [Candidatus Krumholzibacteria bacterium]HPD71477.1 ABC transporter permease [Candidatus Krumholzibacteria bacterium]HRY41590.1 ABC transporter permease [Candidatus Krumholzibacteria bacterium]